MLIIVEGADGSGKTTLANRLRKDLQQYSIFLRSNGPPPNIGKLADIIAWMMISPGHIPVFCDRFPILSEYVYGPIIRGKCQHGLSIEQMAARLSKALIIYCRPNYSALAAGVRKEVQMDGVVINHRNIVQAYDAMMGDLESHGANIKRYDYTGPPQLIMDTVLTYIRENENG